MPQPRVALALTIVSVVLVVLPAAATCSASTTPFVVVRASNGGTPFQGDSSTLVTVSPNGDHFRDAVTIRYWLRGAAAVRLDWARHGAAGRKLQADLGRTSAGEHVYLGAPFASRACRIRAPSLDDAGGRNRRRARPGDRRRRRARRLSPG